MGGAGREQPLLEGREKVVVVAGGNRRKVLQGGQPREEVRPVEPRAAALRRFVLGGALAFVRRLRQPRGGGWLGERRVARRETTRRRGRRLGAASGGGGERLRRRSGETLHHRLEVPWLDVYRRGRCHVDYDGRTLRRRRRRVVLPDFVGDLPGLEIGGEGALCPAFSPRRGGAVWRVHAGSHSGEGGGREPDDHRHGEDRAGGKGGLAIYEDATSTDEAGAGPPVKKMKPRRTRQRLNTSMEEEVRGLVVGQVNTLPL